MNRRGDRDGGLDKGHDGDLWTGAAATAVEEAAATAATWSRDGSRGGGHDGGCLDPRRRQKERSRWRQKGP
jgi:hypothetical protein